MPEDVVSLIIDDKEYSWFSSYTINSDLYVAADDFSIEIPGIQYIALGKKVLLRVNGKLELTGIIDSVTYSGSKEAETTTIEGRDLMGLLCDHHVEDFGTKYSLNGKTVREVTEILIKNIPFVLKEAFTYQWAADRADKPCELIHIRPGQTVFEALKELAIAHGIMFYCLPNGQFVLGKPRGNGAAEYFLVRKKKDSQANNIIHGSVRHDITQAYSKATFSGQVQHSEKWKGDPENMNVTATALLDGFPFYKPYYSKHNRDEISPELVAKNFINICRFRMFQLDYTVDGHSQNGKPWTVNTIANVLDEVLFKNNGATINGDYLVYGRTFELSKETGRITKLKLGLPGVILDD